MGKQKTIIHLFRDFRYNQRYSVFTSTITTDLDGLVYPAIVMGNVYERATAELRRRKFIHLFSSIGIHDGDEVYVVIGTYRAGKEVFAYGSTTQEKWILTDGWKVVDTSDALIQNKI